MKKVTMTEIAKELGVSRSLVSYALQDKYGVGESTRRKIIAKAIQMGYYRTTHPTVKMRNTIAIIIGEEFLGEHSFFARIISGVEYGAVSKKLVPKIIPMEKNEPIEKLISQLMELRPQGVVVIRQFEKKLAEQFKKLNFPLVFIDLIEPTSNCFEVRANNFGNMYEMTERLIKQGFLDFVFVGDTSWALSFNERYNGFVRACKDNFVGYVSITDKSEKEFPFDEKAFKQYVKTHSNSVIVCASDGIATYVYRIIEKVGKKIPEDFSVVGFDDVHESKNLEPPLTTMHIPRFEMGRVAFELLYEQINYIAEEQMHSRLVCLNARFVERSSVLNKLKQ